MKNSTLAQKKIQKYKETNLNWCIVQVNIGFCSLNYKARVASNKFSKIPVLNK